MPASIHEALPQDSPYVPPHAPPLPHSPSTTLDFIRTANSPQSVPFLPRSSHMHRFVSPCALINPLPPR